MNERNTRNRNWWQYICRTGEHEIEGKVVYTLRQDMAQGEYINTGNMGNTENRENEKGNEKGTEGTD